jgi:hypothetical protein
MAAMGFGSFKWILGVERSFVISGWADWAACARFRGDACKAARRACMRAMFFLYRRSSAAADRLLYFVDFISFKTDSERIRYELAEQSLLRHGDYSSPHFDSNK